MWLYGNGIPAGLVLRLYTAFVVCSRDKSCGNEATAYLLSFSLAYQFVLAIWFSVRVKCVE